MRRGLAVCRSHGAVRWRHPDLVVAPLVVRSAMRLPEQLGVQSDLGVRPPHRPLVGDGARRLPVRHGPRPGELCVRGRRHVPRARRLPVHPDGAIALPGARIARALPASLGYRGPPPPRVVQLALLHRACKVRRAAHQNRSHPEASTEDPRREAAWRGPPPPGPRDLLVGLGYMQERGSDAVHADCACLREVCRRHRYARRAVVCAEAVLTGDGQLQAHHG
mmetsp:Transcript_18930/g.48421  ORF Transcript_18930/g.48421 Transcript_18930/m.48421 type:complete len:221 (-) Transcript_18930:443-1105(-)